MAVTREELVAKWVEKLRDPDAQQGFHLLRAESGARCALGFLCDAAGDLGLGSWSKVDEAWLFVDDQGDEGFFNYPNRTITRLFDASSRQDIIITENGVKRNVFSLNDSRRMPLEEIADLVEAEYL